MAEISLQALMRHQYQRSSRTLPVPAPMPSSNCQADWMELMLAAAYPLRITRQYDEKFADENVMLVAGFANRRSGDRDR